VGTLRFAQPYMLSVVMRGLDPRIHLLRKNLLLDGLPGQARQ
jgi:hypothetical protein